MQHEHSFGIIPLRRFQGCWQVFLIQHRAGHWSFPKGHQDGSETPQETAKRELFEETGLSVVQFLPFKELEEYYIFRKSDETVIKKRVTYFMAEAEGDVKLQMEELAEGKWASLSEAMDLITFKEALKICSEVQSLLT